MAERMRVEFDVPKTITEGEALVKIGRDAGSNTTSGTVSDSYRDDVDDGEITWTMRTVGVEVEIDRRQRLAAAALITAFDPPIELGRYASSMLAASDVCPGMSTADIPQPDRGGRLKSLRFAKALCDDMIAEIEGASSRPSA